MVPNNVQMKKKHDPFKLFESELAWDIDVTTNKLQFIADHQIREMSEMLIVDKAWYRTPWVKEYFASHWTPPAQRKHVSINNKWKESNKPQETRTIKPQELKFCINQNQIKLSRDSQYGGSVFVFGGSNVKKTHSESKKPQKSCRAECIAKRWKRANTRRGKVKTGNNEQQKLERSTKVMNVNW